MMRLWLVFFSFFSVFLYIIIVIIIMDGNCYYSYLFCKLNQRFAISMIRFYIVKEANHAQKSWKNIFIFLLRWWRRTWPDFYVNWVSVLQHGFSCSPVIQCLFNRDFAYVDSHPDISQSFPSKMVSIKSLIYSLVVVVFCSFSYFQVNPIHRSINKWLIDL